MSTQDLAQSLGTRETPWLECESTAKRAGKRGDAIGNAVCAMANDLAGRRGGDILVGVDDKGEPVDGVDTSDQALLALTDLRDDGRILDRPSFTVQAAVYQGKPVVHIRVEASGTPPVRFDGVVWVRPGPTTRRATRDYELRAGGGGVEEPGTHRLADALGAPHPGVPGRRGGPVLRGGDATRRPKGVRAARRIGPRRGSDGLSWRSTGTSRGRTSSCSRSHRTPCRCTPT